LSVLPRNVERSLLVAQVLGAATLLRSIAYDRWITVLVALLLITGTVAAQRGRTWGVALAFAVAAWFPVAFLVGIAPAWFVLVGLASALPFAQLWRSFARFDRGATVLLAGMAITGGALGAIVWKNIAWTIFTMIPALRPGAYAQHGLAVAATLAVMVAVVIRGRPRGALGPEPTQARIGERTRIGVSRDQVQELGDEALEEASFTKVNAGAYKDLKD